MGSRLAGAALAGLLICAPPPASARGRGHDRSHGHHRHHDRHHEHGDWCAPRHDSGYSYGYRPAPGYGWYAPPPVVYARYRCEPCGYWYDEEASFHRHIHRHHHIAQAVIPMVIGAAAFGWIFYGH
jgi:hypothetical protein